ncbi:MAG: aminotransferase class I/II-fold pyridoxal phosphate-dependent enzyme, partial [Burkholderiales bacterium]
MIIDKLVASVIRDDVRAIKAYPVSPALGMIKLDAMENPYRLPEALRDEIGRAISHADINRYPDPTAPTLKAMLREVFEVPPTAEIVIGNGSDELIAMLTQAIARPSATILGLEPSFVMYKINAGFSQVRYEGVSLRPDFSLDVAALLE